jgi:hypothetical protein
MPLPTPKTGESEAEYVARCMKAQEGEDKPSDQKLAICYSQYRGDTSVDRGISFDTTTLDDKILVDDDNYLVMPAVIASEIVHEYEDGWAYKPAVELEKMAKTANDIGAVPVKILEHPGPECNYLVIRQSDVYGRAENFTFVKNLKDPKTSRPMRRGVRADIRWFKNRVPEDIIEKIKNNTLRDVSIGFTRDKDNTAGEFNGTHYDYIQRNIFLNHVAAPIETGRCPGPVCGIGFDAMDEATLAKCPVCRKIKEVGFLTSGQRLFTKYGADVLRVIGEDAAIEHEKKTVKPHRHEADDLDVQFRKAFTKLSQNLQE